MMEKRVQCALTAGVALVGASAIAITPVTVPTAASHRVVDAAPALMALQDFQHKNQAELVAMFGQRVAEQFAQAPFIPLVAAFDIAAGGEEGNERLYTVIRSIIDAPLYVSDPLTYAAAMTLPEALGGNPEDPSHSEIWAGFRDGQLYPLRQKLHQPFADALGVAPGTDANYAWDLTQKVQESAMRTVEGAVLAPVGLAAIAKAMAEGNRGDLYLAIRQYVDAPLWVADPTISGLAKALPESLGGTTKFDEAGHPEGGGLGAFRLEAWKATSETRRAVAKALGVELDGKDDPKAPESARIKPAPTPALLRASNTEQPQEQQTPPLANRESQESNMSERETRAQAREARAQAREERVQARKERAQQRVQARVDRAQARAEKAQAAVKDVAKKLTPKKTTPKKQDKKKNSDD